MKRCISLRLRLREGPVQLAERLGIAPSTVHRILASARLNRLSHVDRATGEPIRRYEHSYPGALVHVDVKKLGNIPDGGGWRYVGRRQGERNRAATPGKPRSRHRAEVPGLVLQEKRMFVLTWAGRRRRMRTQNRMVIRGMGGGC